MLLFECGLHLGVERLRRGKSAGSEWLVVGLEVWLEFVCFFTSHEEFTKLAETRLAQNSLNYIKVV